MSIKPHDYLSDASNDIATLNENYFRHTNNVATIEH